MNVVDMPRAFVIAVGRGSMAKTAAALRATTRHFGRSADDEDAPARWWWPADDDFAFAYGLNVLRSGGVRVQFVGPTAVDGMIANALAAARGEDPEWTD